MDVKALKESIANLNYIRNLIETSDYNLGFNERMDKFMQCLDRFEYDTSAVVAEITTNSILYAEQMRPYYKQVFRLVREQKQYIKSIIETPTYEMNTNGDVYVAVHRYLSYAEKFVLKMTALLPNDIEEEVQDEIPENLYILEDVASKLLFLRYSGLIPTFKEDIEKGKISKAHVSRVLSYLFNTKPSNVQTLMGNLLHFNIKKTDNTPFKIQYVTRALKALDDAQVDATELREIYSKLLKQSKKD